jgi:uncharacterized LabA/DUF88 family protein
MKRVIAYIDGFNLYHALHDLEENHLKWLNIWSLMTSLLQSDEQLMKVYYFSAYAPWRISSHIRHQIYVKALEVSGVSPVMGNFKNKNRSCHHCGYHWLEHEEKKSDVNIAIKMICDAYDDNFDRCILVTSDSDLVPVLKILRRKFSNKSVLVATPPKRHERSRDLRAHASSYSLTKGRIKEHLFPTAINSKYSDALIIERPQEYDPPCHEGNKQSPVLK